MKLFRNTALILLAALILNILASSLIEMNAMSTSTHNLRTAITVASQYALNSFEINQFSGYDKNLGGSYDIGDVHNRNAYMNYLNSLEDQGRSYGFTASGSDFQSIIDFLKNEVSSYNPSNAKSSVVGPFAFGWTFLEKNKLEKEFEQCLRNIINSNYNPSNDNTTALAFSGLNVLRIKSVKAEILRGPNLVNLTTGLNPKDPAYKTYLKLFGSTKTQSVNMINGINAFEVMYNYVITYEVRFTVEWEHHTVTPFFYAGELGRNLMSQFVNEKKQIKINMPTMIFTRQYTILN